MELAGIAAGVAMPLVHKRARTMNGQRTHVDSRIIHVKDVCTRRACYACSTDAQVDSAQRFPPFSSSSMSGRAGAQAGSGEGNAPNIIGPLWQD